MEAVRSYQQTMTALERPDQVNYPDPRAASSAARLDWPYLFNAFRPDLPLARKLGLGLTAMAFLWLVYEARRAVRFSREAPTTGAFLGPLACFSLLCVYHHHYDITILLAPLIVYLCRDDLRRLAGTAWFAVPVIAFAGLFQMLQIQLLFERHFGWEAGSLLTKPAGAASVTLAFIASGAALHHHIGRRLAKENERRSSVVPAFAGEHVS